MKFYLFEHCPYCVKALMVANYLNIELSQHYLLNDDESLPKQLIGQKMVPILQFDDGSAIGESLDIASYFADSKNVQLPMGQYFDEINRWVTKHYELFLSLTFPRWPRLELPEFSTKEAIYYYVEKKQVRMDKQFDQLMDETPNLITKMEGALKELSWVKYEDGLNWADVNLFPFLRNLTVVKGLTFPKNLVDYTKQQAQRCEINTFEGYAC